MKRVLVAYASKTGSTHEIAKVVGGELRAAGIDVDVRSAGDVYGVGSYQAVLLGSALYAGKWRRPAVRLLKHNADELRKRPVWLFHCGLVEVKSAGRQIDLPPNVARLATGIGAAPVVTFDGRLDASIARGPLARSPATRPHEEDFRDWDCIRSWARGVAGEVTGSPPASGSLAS